MPSGSQDAQFLASMDGERPGSLGTLHHKNGTFLGVYRETKCELCTDRFPLMLPEKGDSASVCGHTPTTAGDGTSAPEGAILRSLLTAIFGNQPQMAEQSREERTLQN